MNEIINATGKICFTYNQLNRHNEGYIIIIILSIFLIILILFMIIFILHFDNRRLEFDKEGLRKKINTGDQR